MGFFEAIDCPRDLAHPFGVSSVLKAGRFEHVDGFFKVPVQKISLEINLATFPAFRAHQTQEHQDRLETKCWGKDLRKIQALDLRKAHSNKKSLHFDDGAISTTLNLEDPFGADDLPSITRGNKSPGLHADKRVHLALSGGDPEI